MRYVLLFNIYRISCDVQKPKGVHAGLTVNGTMTGQALVGAPVELDLLGWSPLASPVDEFRPNPSALTTAQDLDGEKDTSTGPPLSTSRSLSQTSAAQTSRGNMRLPSSAARDVTLGIHDMRFQIDALLNRIPNSGMRVTIPRITPATLSTPSSIVTCAQADGRALSSESGEASGTVVERRADSSVLVAGAQSERTEQAPQMQSVDIGFLSDNNELVEAQIHRRSEVSARPKVGGSKNDGKKKQSRGNGKRGNSASSESSEAESTTRESSGESSQSHSESNKANSSDKESNVDNRDEESIGTRRGWSGSGGNTKKTAADRTADSSSKSHPGKGRKRKQDPRPTIAKGGRTSGRAKASTSKSSKSKK